MAALKTTLQETEMKLCFDDVNNLCGSRYLEHCVVAQRIYKFSKV